MVDTVTIDSSDKDQGGDPNTPVKIDHDAVAALVDEIVDDEEIGKKKPIGYPTNDNCPCGCERTYPAYGEGFNYAEYEDSSDGEPPVFIKTPELIPVVETESETEEPEPPKPEPEPVTEPEPEPPKPEPEPPIIEPEPEPEIKEPEPEPPKPEPEPEPPEPEPEPEIKEPEPEPELPEPEPVPEPEPEPPKPEPEPEIDLTPEEEEIIDKADDVVVLSSEWPCDTEGEIEIEQTLDGGVI